MKVVFIGVDIGGTNTVIGLFDEKNRLISKMGMPTTPSGNHRSPYDFVDRLSEEIRRLIGQAGTAARLVKIGVGVPGQLDLRTGTVLRAPNLGWYDFELSAELYKRLGVHPSVDNDVRMYTLGEVTAGAAQGYQNVLCLTLGTGIASGVIVNDQLVRGSHGYAGEIGHDPVDGQLALCKCGKTGCLETIASATGIVRLAKEAVERGADTSLRSLENPLTAFHVYEAAVKGDIISKDIFNFVGSVLGKKLTTMIYLLDPEVIVIGGGAAAAGEILLEPIRNTIYGLYPKNHKPLVLQGKLGDSAGLFGAVHFARHHNDQ